MDTSVPEHPDGTFGGSELREFSVTLSYALAGESRAAARTAGLHLDATATATITRRSLEQVDATGLWEQIVAELPETRTASLNLSGTDDRGHAADSDAHLWLSLPPQDRLLDVEDGAEVLTAFLIRRRTALDTYEQLTAAFDDARARLHRELTSDGHSRAVVAAVAGGAVPTAGTLAGAGDGEWPTPAPLRWSHTSPTGDRLPDHVERQLTGATAQIEGFLDHGAEMKTAFIVCDTSSHAVPGSVVELQMVDACQRMRDVGLDPALPPKLTHANELYQMNMSATPRLGSTFSPTLTRATLRQLPGLMEVHGRMLLRMHPDDVAHVAEQVADAQARQDAETSAAEAEVADERAVWISAHGSKRLQRIADAGLLETSLAVYEDERRALERPGFIRSRLGRLDLAVHTRQVRNVDVEALDVLDAARAVDPDAELAHVQIPKRLCATPDDQELAIEGSLATSAHRGETVVMPTPSLRLLLERAGLLEPARSSSLHRGTASVTPPRARGGP